MPAYKYFDYDNTAVELENLPKRQSYKTAPIHKDNKKIQKQPKDKTLILNTVLLVTGGIIAVVFVAIYSVVAISETRLSNLHSHISELNYENIDLENKLENVKSYYSVDTKVSASASFDKAKNVIEVDKVDAKTVNHEELLNNDLQTVTGF